MDHAHLVCCGETSAGGDERAHRAAPIGFAVLPRLLEVVAQGLARDVLHGEEHRALVGAHVVDRDHARVGEPGHRLGFTQQARAPSRGVVPCVFLGSQQLDRDPSVQLGVKGRVDDAHPARAEAVEDDVATERTAPRKDHLLLGRPVVPLLEDRLLGLPHDRGRFRR